ncbi:MAG: tRNA (adenosine(37)-N6)-threonylcarbamoyltransferase complex transferase subunit TsaD, partial [Negativicutes bacterium]|nr:tRNA (adenosine(37)-N6)-threonylcarbamoyltransferase complex transferase subunit TsaD [Negativicutes bacterium]
ASDVYKRQVVDMALSRAAAKGGEVDAVAVTAGPGLIGGLLVGLVAAKALAWAWGVPLIAVNHIEAHINAVSLSYPQVKPPFVALVVSGGHTALFRVATWREYRLLGQTRDDAAGETIDKVARVLGLPYPGGPQLEQLALSGKAGHYHFPGRFPSLGDYEFSFSGLKSAAVNIIANCRQRRDEIRRADFAFSFQAAVFGRLVDQTVTAAVAAGVPLVVLAGGVAANATLRRMLADACRMVGIDLVCPAPEFCTDNAAMVAIRALRDWQEGVVDSLEVNAHSVWPAGTAIAE